MEIYCNGCTQTVDARLTDGSEIYPHRADLKSLPFWICDTCGNYVGCHHLSSEPTKPKGSIPTKDIRDWRVYLHRKVDPLWMRHAGNRKKQRQIVYAMMSTELGYTYHSGDVSTEEQFKRSVNAANRVSKELKRRGKL